jgi:RHO1 GDP-GTP exchange protein 1/2
MSQVIQGNNLRLLFADTPPSTTNTASQMTYNPVYPGGHGYQPYGAMPQANAYGSRQSVYSPSPQTGYPNHYPRPSAQPFGRDEILMVSDDRVLTLRLATHSQAPMSDSASMMSIPR